VNSDAWKRRFTKWHKGSHQDLSDNDVAADNEIAIPDIGKSCASDQATST
jgi:hypothetical protein